MPRGETKLTTRRSLWAIRATARAPRVVWIVACVVLSAVGLSAILAPRPPAVVPARGQLSPDLASQAVAEAFARAYLTWDATAPDLHERRVAPFLARDVGPAAGVTVPSAGAQRVRWTTVVADRAVGVRRRIITIAAETTRGLLHLAVPVSRDGRGALFVSAVPAVVGPPPHASAAAGRPEAEVDVRALRTVGARVVRNYLAGERDDLAADLDPRATISLPDQRLKVRSTDAITWVSAPRRAAVLVTAEAPHGLRLSLRYELSVAQVGGRWVVRTIHTNPIAREGDR